jgi:hypothetical protein
VEERKIGIVQDALDESMDMSMPEGVRNDTGLEDIWRTQKYLKLMGLYNGLLNGVEDDSTIYAVKTFQIGAGLPVTGRADKELAALLRTLWVSRNTPKNIGF